jgi:hypothetical protein
MTELVTACQCPKLGPEFPCSAQMTAEDLLCSQCRQCRLSRPEEDGMTACMAVLGSDGPHFTVTIPPGTFRFLPRGS